MQGNKADFSTIRERIADLLRNKQTKLPTLPVVAQNIIEVSRDPDSSARDLASFIEKDQAIANKVLRMANSPYFGMGKKVDSIQRAITIIGFDEIVGFAVSIGILPSLKTHSIGKIMDMQQLWLHSVANSFAARTIVHVLQRKMTGSASHCHSIFLPALLHDMGKVLFAIYFPNEYALVIEEALQKQHYSLPQVEKQMLGLHHAAFAAQLMEHWNFPESIVIPVRYHHTPGKSPVMGLETRILYFANGLARKANLGYSYNTEPYKTEEIAANLGLDMEDLTQCLQTLDQQRAEIEQFLQYLS